VEGVVYEHSCFGRNPMVAKNDEFKELQKYYTT
jgi:hypothetical protein